MERKILLLGDPKLYEKSAPVEKDQLPQLRPVIRDLHDTLMAFRAKYHVGRAIAAPQIGVQKRILYMCADESVVFINPTLELIGAARMEVFDDCMSFPGLKVKVMRHRTCRIRYLDLNWNAREMALEDDLAELLQHEFDHLDGILATMRAIDGKSFYYQDIMG